MASRVQSHPQPQPLASTSQLISSPSNDDGVPKEVESDLRVAGCMMIQEAGVMLGLTMAIAQVVFHRFYFVSSMASFGVNDISISALYLSSKLNETPVRLRDLINTYIFLTARIKHLLSLPADRPFPIDQNVGSEGEGGSNGLWRIGGGGSSNGKGKEKEVGKVWEGFVFEVPGFHDEVFWDWKDVITASEMQILKRLGFQMQVDLPYSHVINYLKILDLVFEADVAQKCWSIVNDMLLTPLYVIHPPNTLACAAILLTTRLKRIPLPRDWYILFDVAYDDIWSCCGAVMTLWDDWGLGTSGSESEKASGSGRLEKENRWRRSWILSQSRRAVRKWIKEREGSNETLGV